MSTSVEVITASAEFIARSTRPVRQLPLTELKFELNNAVAALVDNKFQQRRLSKELARLDDRDQSHSSMDSAVTHADRWCCCEECGRPFAREIINKLRMSDRLRSSQVGSANVRLATESDGSGDGLEA